MMMKLFSLIVGAVGVMVMTGLPAQLSASPAVMARWQSVSHTGAAAIAAGAIPDAGARWAESGSLLLLASGMFGAAVLIGRRRV
jgi:hypothetical protein